MIKLVVADIDNTLVPKHMPISERARSDINKLREKGILFGLASGRDIESLHILEEKWGIHCDLIIGLNGGELYDDLTKFQKRYYVMEPEWIKEVVEIMRPFDCNMYTFYGGKTYVTRIDNKVESSNKYIDRKPDADSTVIVTDEKQFYGGASPKVGCRINAEDWPAMEERIKQFPSKNYVGFRTEFTMLEFCNINATKGAMLKIFCENHNIDLSEVASFGDMTNDISMLEISGMAVCLLNGSDDTKAVCNYITEKTVDEDGFADFVEKHILNQD